MAALKLPKPKTLIEGKSGMNVYSNRIYEFSDKTKRYVHRDLGETNFKDRREALTDLKRKHPKAFAYHVELISGSEPEKKKKQ